MLYTDLAIATKKYGSDSIQVQEIQEKIRLKQEQIEQQTNDLKQAQQQLSLTYISTSASMVTAITSLGSGFSSLAGVIGGVNKMAMLTFVSSPWGLAITGIATAVGILVFNVGGLRDALFETLKQFYEWLKTLPVLGFWLQSIENLIKEISKALNMQSPEIKMPSFEEVQSEYGSKIDSLIKSKAKRDTSLIEDQTDLELQSSLLNELESEPVVSESKPKKSKSLSRVLNPLKNSDFEIQGVKDLNIIKDELDYLGDRKFVFKEELLFARIRKAEEERDKLKKVISFEDLIQNLPKSLLPEGSQISLTKEGMLAITWKTKPEEIKAGLPETQTLLRPIEEIFRLIDENLPYKVYQKEQQIKQAQAVLQTLPANLIREGSDIQIKNGQLLISWKSSPEEIKAGVPERMSIGRSIDELLRFPSKLFTNQERLVQNQDKNTQLTVNALNSNTIAIKELSQILKGGIAKTTKGQTLAIGGIDPSTGQKIIGMETYENRRTGESKVVLRTKEGNTITYLKNRD
jgi:hypothetical protein